MEQAVNSFLKGLLLDTHPMQLDTTSLSDALNATLITMDGNEVILLTDMGNASIENVHLPSGYVPVGMKEFGGVIYIASYNPLTNRSQIGSFPSPLLRFYSGRLSGEEDFPSFTLSNFMNPDLLEKEAFRFRSMMIPLDDNQLIRAGDKFQLYSNNLHTIKLYVSNWNNAEENIIKSSKNNYLTLSVGVLNSRNEFVDITKTLARFDDGGNRLTFDNISEDVIFNSGYFIVNNSLENYIPEENDLNTYAYKLVGPLYLKIDLNLPVDFDYSIEGYKSGESVLNLNVVSTYNITITSTIKYNCPDYTNNFIYDREKNIAIYNSYIYNYYEEVEKGGIRYSEYRSSILGGGYIYKLFDTEKFYIEEGGELVFINDEILNFRLYQNSNEIETSENSEYSLHKYDFINNIYLITIKNHYLIQSTENTINYTIVPTIKFPKWNNSGYDLTPIEISDLQQEGELELFKLGTGEMELTAWRFYNDLENQKTSLAYSFDAYPKPGHEFKDLLFDFYKVVGDVLTPPLDLDTHLIGGTIYVGTHVSENTIGYNGNFDEIIDWKNLGEGLLGLEEQEMYLVIITWKDYDGTTSIEDYDFRWLLTTELFNNSYSTFDKRYIKDFCNPKDTIEWENYNKLVTLDPYLTGEYDNLKLTLKEDLIGQLFTFPENNDDRGGLKFEWGYNTEYNASSDVKVKLEWNSLNYPKYLSVSEPLIYLTDSKIEVVNKNIDWNKNVNWEEVLLPGKTLESVENEMISYENTDSEYLVRPQYGEFNYTSNIKINLKDCLFSKYEKKPAYAKYKFESFKSYITNCQDNIKGDTSVNPYYFSIGPAMRNHSGRGTLLFVFLSYGSKEGDSSRLHNYDDKTVFGENSTSAVVYWGLGKRLWDDSAKRNDMSLSVKSSLFLDAVNIYISELYPLEDGIFLIEGDFPILGGAYYKYVGNNEYITELERYRGIWARIKTGKNTFGWAFILKSDSYKDVQATPNKYINDLKENFKDIYGCFSLGTYNTDVKTLNFENIIYNTLYNILISLINIFTIHTENGIEIL